MHIYSATLDHEALSVATCTSGLYGKRTILADIFFKRHDAEDVVVVEDVYGLSRRLAKHVHFSHIASRAGQ